MKLTIRRTANCRSVTWAVCVQQNHFSDYKSLDHCMSMCKDPTICILSLSYFSFSNLVQSGGNNPESEDDHLRFSNWKTMKQRFSNWKTMKQRFSNWETLKQRLTQSVTTTTLCQNLLLKTLYIWASAALDRLVQPSWHSYCGSNVFWTFLLNQTVFNSRQTLIRILVTACRRGICPVMAIGGSGMRPSLTKDSCYEEGDSWRNFHTIPI